MDPGLSGRRRELTEVPARRKSVGGGGKTMGDELDSKGPSDSSGQDGGTAAGYKPKSIVLFSDGTGNSSARLFKTNVWRMYEAIDLGATAIDPQQIVYYDEGVGNSGFRPLAILGGVFGWGLKRNVLDLYSFLCRNYKKGDRIYAFGFSRGAFTIRVLVGLIAKQGVIDYKDERDLVHQAADAYRVHTRDRAPRFPPMRWLLPLWRFAMSWLLLGKRKSLNQRVYDVRNNHKPRVRFVGLWDTVAAYGGPIVELVRAFDDWIRPLSLRNQILSDKVDFGRQALALDDERDAFHPVPWDEPRGTDRERIKQVWFAGAHADVGGGYPDDSLAYVSLAWMMEEARAAGLDLRAEKVVEANRVANAFGPIHDPRAGFGAYYRYQPRIVGAYVEPPEPGTESQEDPELRNQGLNQRAWVHQSVIHRIRAGTDGYAPITLPETFQVVDHEPADASISAQVRGNLARTAAARADRQETLRDLVWWRRVFYFTIVAASLALATMPLWLASAGERVCSDDRCVLGTIFGWLRYVLPGFAEPWIKTFSEGPGWTVLFLVLILTFMSFGTIAERRLRDGTRKLWREALAGQVAPDKRRPWVRGIRTSSTYQGIVGFIKWQVLPFAFGLTMLAVLAWAVALAAAQLRLSGGEGRGLFCRPGSPPAALFETRNPCNSTGLKVGRGLTYEIRFYVQEPWQDGSSGLNATTPEGIAAGKLPYKLGYVAAPFRRVINARYLQPLAAVARRRSNFTTVDIATVHITALTPVRAGPNEWVSEFTAPATGQLSLFANDAVPPWPFDAGHFYRGSASSLNRGTACVAISMKRDEKLVPIVTCESTCVRAADAPPPPPGVCRWHYADPAKERERQLGRLQGTAISGR
jgi:uncharacterized protein (DUF2235 family)